MTVIYAVPVAACSPDDTTVRAFLAPERLAYIDQRHGKARAQSFTATLLLEYAIARQYPAIRHPLSIVLSDAGKPRLATHPHIQFSLSHSGDWAICAVSSLPVGVDIQLCHPGRSPIAARFFHPAEAQYIAALPLAQRDAAFYALWVLKEGFIKATGNRYHLTLRQFCIDLPTLSVSGERVTGPYTFAHIPFVPNQHYQLGLCLNGYDDSTPTLQIVRYPSLTDSVW